ncbi:hypothetical protein LMH87_005810 [Akanthomyces muscarius]|uniref:RRM domain-containing protein n=1 Tax=Akanthomyces muscarius TaxID=2231603 RepID=A0A9W8US89_AKAMU|nr:hypothetical protein LMH87_005810 [Akanthomyces muscarius]KAJ4164125.1 hypothetical protein LMH87_005810 [Akanthomyces muscarius]
MRDPSAQSFTSLYSNARTFLPWGSCRWALRCPFHSHALLTLATPTALVRDLAPLAVAPEVPADKDVADLTPLEAGPTVETTTDVVATAPRWLAQELLEAALPLASTMMSNVRESSQQDRRVYVGNLSYDVKWHHLKDFMRQAGDVLFADVLLLPNGMSKGCG